MNINTNSKPDFSLITLYANDSINIPPCHLAFKVTSNMIIGRKLNMIPKNTQLIYKLLLQKENFLEFQVAISEFIAWCKERNAMYLISIPEIMIMGLKECTLNLVKLHEIKRPFHKVNYLLPHG